MTLPVYSTGTVSVSAGGTTVTGAGSMWSGINAKQGDFFTRSDGMAVITEVTDGTHLKITPWPGATVSGGPYAIEQNYVGRVVGVAAAEDVGEMLEKLHTDGLPFIVGADETVPDPSYGDDGQFAFKPTTGEWWIKDSGAWVPSEGIGATGAVRHDVAQSLDADHQAQARINIGVPVEVIDYADATAAVAAVISETGGGTILVPNGVAPTPPPVNYPNIDFDYYGPKVPVNLYTEAGPSESTATRLIRGQLAASTTGTAQSVLAIENRPVGASINGPAQGSYALSISSVKQGWVTTTQPGEIGCLNLVARNGGLSGGNTSDVSAILANVQNIGPSGFAVAFEADVTNVSATTFAVLKGIHVHFAAIDAVGGTSQALVLGANGGVIDNGLLLQCAAGSSFTAPIAYKNSGGTTLFGVDTSGKITGSDLVITNPWTTTGALAVTSNGGAFTSATAVGRMKRIGTTCFLQVWVNITTVGSASGIIQVTLPVTAGAGSGGGLGYVLSGFCANNNKSLLAYINSGLSILNFVNYDGTAAILAGGQYVISGMLETT